jgi:hypothetical protein
LPLPLIQQLPNREIRAGLSGWVVLAPQKSPLCRERTPAILYSGHRGEGRRHCFALLFRALRLLPLDRSVRKQESGEDPTQSKGEIWMKSLWALLTLFVFTFAAYAGDISGTWKGTAESPIGTVERTFVFKVDGNKLTGETTSNMFGKSTIDDGKVDGDTISFSISITYQGNNAKVTYKGVVNGDEIKLTAESADLGSTIEYTVKRVP